MEVAVAVEVDVDVEVVTDVEPSVVSVVVTVGCSVVDVVIVPAVVSVVVTVTVTVGASVVEVPRMPLFPLFPLLPLFALFALLHHAKHPYHSGRAEDVSVVLAHLRAMFPQKKQISIGYSMSGNILLCLLGGFRGKHKPDGAITVNAPLSLKAGSKLLKTGFNRIYDIRFVTRLRKNINEKYKLGLIDEPYKVPPWATVWDMDEIYTAPAGGFKSREDYYASCSSIHYLPQIDVPTYALTAEDDPFVSVHNYLSAPFSKFTSVHIEKRGGHLGYIARKPTPLGSIRWLDYYLCEALKGLENTLR
ncbi:hypothetical protein QJS83_07080 [Bdellovibrio sp. 22V]|uniref:YheT family hydrolase n=1 Tax=Bdellovibrio sp. 22V TaxID=3044166 RepID=UPI002542DCA1|nr:alpha/beta fold hydrolase [Bdellovibrio sp. 22V]WII73635.1 hypothetical protein QJS83_07080 [Bdellovibrio sp. 22V]